METTSPVREIGGRALQPDSNSPASGPALHRKPGQFGLPVREMPPKPENATEKEIEAWLWECWCRRTFLGSGT